MSGDIPTLPQYAFMAWCQVKAQRQIYLYVYLYLYLRNYFTYFDLNLVLGLYAWSFLPILMLVLTTRISSCMHAYIHTYIYTYKQYTYIYYQHRQRQNRPPLQEDAPWQQHRDFLNYRQNLYMSPKGAQCQDGLTDFQSQINSESDICTGLYIHKMQKCILYACVHTYTLHIYIHAYIHKRNYIYS